MIRVDFDQPAYQRASIGLAILSSRLQHLLPKQDYGNQKLALSETVEINRLYNGPLIKQNAEVANLVDEAVKGEFIPLETDSSSIDDALPSEDVELNFGGIKGKSFSGSYGGSGYAHYRFNKKNGKSFFVRIGKHIIWGIELAPEIRRSGAARGEVIKITFMGKEPVTVLKDVQKGDHKDSEWINTHKNLWKVEVVS